MQHNKLKQVGGFAVLETGRPIPPKMIPFIVHACNSHDDIVEALESLLTWAQNYKAESKSPTMRHARAMLEKAKES
jgi:hypothetical protein